MKKAMILFMLTTLVVSCNSQTKEKKMEIKGSIKKNEDKLYIEYLPLMEKLLRTNGYKFLEHQDFKNKINEYFGVDIYEAKFNDVFLERGLGFTAMGNEGFIDTYQVDRGIINGAGDAFAEILKEDMNNNYNVDFVNYNKILFNDELMAISKISKDAGKTEDIVVYLNYEKNNFLYSSFIKNLKKIDEYNDDFKWHLLWYNNRSKSEIIRKKMISDITTKNPEFIFDLAYFLHSNATKVKEKVESKLLEQTLAYLIEVELKNYEDKDLSDNKGYSLLNNFYVQNPDLLNKFKANGYYNYSLVNNYTQTYLSMSDEESLFFGKIIDKDGFTNLRKDKTTSSEILQKIITGSQVEVLDNSGDWWLVQTKEGKKGYVYKTKIKVD
ncbi:SH3 domain-containing protein [Flavobacterium sp. HTF]|uniref:SH3 domain-containing protein n=1 Tax=Flavobacterium sp. HTF TaxID=2170732 RepID=UPI00140388EB|nr:SH3 domain-containing protein [Flavobacterium sp. HTF]